MVGAGRALRRRAFGLRRNARARDLRTAVASGPAQRQIRRPLRTARHGSSRGAARRSLPERRLAFSQAAAPALKLRAHLVLLFVALIALPPARAAAAEYRASSYVFGTIAEITVVENGAARAQDIVEEILREFDRRHRELQAGKPRRRVA